MVVSAAAQQCSHYRIMVADDVLVFANHFKLDWCVVFAAEEDVINFGDAAKFEEFNNSFSDGGHF